MADVKSFPEFLMSQVVGLVSALANKLETSLLKTSLTDNSDSYIASQKAVKTAVDAKLDKFQFSTSEVATGNKWLNGEAIYRRIIDFGAMPNNTTKSVNHNIAGNPVAIVCRAFIKGIGTPIPNPITMSGVAAYTRIMFSATKVSIDAAYNYSASEAFVILEYYKTT